MWDGLCVSYPRAFRRAGDAHVRVAGAATRSRWDHVTGQIMGSERRLIEPLLSARLIPLLLSRSGLCGGRPLVAATRARPVLLSVLRTPALALGIGGIGARLRLPAPNLPQIIEPKRQANLLRSDQIGRASCRERV